MPTLDLPATFVDDVDVPLSAADLNQLRDIAILLDGLTFRRMNVTCSSGVSGGAATVHPGGDYRQSWWGLRFTTGMTTLTITGTCASQIDIYLDGVLNTTQATSASFTKNITLTGYTDGQIILIEIRTNGNPAPPTGHTTKYVIWDIYGSPVVTSSSWPGVPTFAGTYSAALLNQLRDAAQYIWDRVCAIPIVPIVAQLDVASTHKVQTVPLFAGGVGRYTSSDVLRIGIQATGGNVAEHYEIYYNGALSVTGATFTVGETISVAHSITLTHTLGTHVEFYIQSVCTDASNQDPDNTVNTRYTITAMRSEATYASASPPTAFTAEESISAATLNSRLNAIATMLSDAKARLDARPEQWNRAPAFRRMYALDDHEVAKSYKRLCAQFSGRQGDTLIVRGKAVKIAYGARTVEDPGESNDTPNPINYGKFTWANEVSVGGSTDDQIVTSEVRLDALVGLEPGVVFYVFSPDALAYAATYISR